MLMELLATVVIGFAAAGALMLVNRLIGGILPRWSAPVVGGLAMLTYQIWSEYTWFDRTAASLPPGITVTRSHEDSAWWRPWTFLAPQIVRFSAVDVAGARRNSNRPGEVMADVLLFARHSPIVLVPNLIDCPGHRVASLMDGAEFGADGGVVDPSWSGVPADDPLIAAVCRPEDSA